LTSLHPEQFSIKDSIWFLGMLIVGGLGSTIGVVFGTIFIRLLDVLVEFISPFLGVVLLGLSTQAQSSLSLISFGLVVIIFLVIEPRGLAHRWEIFKAYYRLWPYSY
jgi:branched-chain amino acid transport system permease protein